MTDPAYQLMPPDLAAEIPRIGKQEGKGDETWLYAKIFLPVGSDTYYIAEHDGDGRCYGLYHTNGTYDQLEWGYFYLPEMAAIDTIPKIGRRQELGVSILEVDHSTMTGIGRKGVGFERDLYWNRSCAGYVRAQHEQNEKSPYWDKPFGLEDKQGEDFSEITYLCGHHSPEMAYVIDDYPTSRGGRSRCEKRVWLERVETGASKGKYRVCYQTTTPKHKWGAAPHYPGKKWRAVKKATAATLVVLYLDKNGHQKDETYHNECGTYDRLLRFRATHYDFFEQDQVMGARLQELLDVYERKMKMEVIPPEKKIVGHNGKGRSITEAQKANLARFWTG